MSKPIRMCISCKGRFPQDELFRFCVKNSVLVNFNGEGRSLYLCQNCVKENQKRLTKILIGKYKVKEESINQAFSTH